MSETITKTDTENKTGEQTILRLSNVTCNYDVDQDTLLEREIVFNQEILESRVGDIQEIHENMIQISDIMNNLSELVGDQLEPIRTISHNTKTAKNRANDGLKQLEKADKYQDSGCYIA